MTTHIHIGIDTCMAETVIRFALVLVRKHFICFLDFLELFFSRFAVGIAIGMKLHRKLAISFFNFIIRGIFSNP